MNYGCKLVSGQKTYIFKNGLLGTKVPISRVCLFVLVVVEDLT